MNTYKSAIIELKIPVAANIIKIKRGTEANIPVLEAGELAFTTDTYKLFVGDGTNNHQVGGEDVVAKAHTQGTDTTLGVQTQDLNMGNHKIVNVVEPTNNQDAATKHYVDSNIPINLKYNEYSPDYFEPTDWDTWEDMDLSGIVGAKSVIVFILIKNGDNGNHSGGVREVGSNLDREFFIAGYGSSLFITKTDSNGHIEAYMDDDSLEFRVMGTLEI